MTLVKVAVERAEELKGVKTTGVKTTDDSVIKSLSKLPSVPEGNLPDIDHSDTYQSKSVESEQLGNTTPSSTSGNKQVKCVIKIKLYRITNVFNT